jgi:hypothetical protein
MKSKIIILFAIISSLLTTGFSQDVRSWSSLDSNSIMIGDQINYNIGISVPPSTSVRWPAITDTLTHNIEVLNRSKIDTLEKDGLLNINQTFLITSFDSGYFEVPEASFDYRLPDDTTIYQTSTGTLFLQVFVPEVDTAQDFKPITGPIQEPYTLAEVLPWIIVVTAGLLLIAILIWFIIKRKKKQPIFQKKPKPLLPPHVDALNKLEELRLAKVWQNGRVKEYYTDLADITREYLERRFDFDALEMTSYEILIELKDKKINSDAFSKLENVLQLSDLVKFAKSQPTPLENDLGLSHCVDFVNETKEVHDSTQEELNEDNTENLSKNG